MSITWLANADPSSFWAHRPWSDFKSAPNAGQRIAVVPLFGFADHGMGLPVDAEEILGAAVIKHAVTQADGATPCWVLPPVRFGLAPYSFSYFGIDCETAHALLHELADGLRRAGIAKVVFFNTSPWNRELLIDASRDIRIELKLQTFIVNTPALGFDFHPTGAGRPQAQAAVCHLLGQTPVWLPRDGDVADVDFRPGRFRQPPPVSLDKTLDGAAILSAAGHHFARLLADIHAYPALGETARSKTVPLPNLPPPANAFVFPEGYRQRYLPAMTREELEALPDKDKALVIIPTGAIEQHGPHLPVGVDAILGQAWVKSIVSKTAADASVYVAPCLTFGKSNEHIAFPGTLSLSAQTYRKILSAVVVQLKRLGFRQIALLNTHGGNSAANVYTLRELQVAHDLRIGILGWPYKPETSAQEMAYGFHAGEWETSLMLAAADELVAMDKAVCEYPAQLSDPGEVRPEGAAVTVSWATEDVSKSGVMGDATIATREKGQRWFQEGSAVLARRIEELLRSR
jgi:creatinine amidohydrolase